MSDETTAAIVQVEPTPLALIAAAIDKGIDPDKLGKLMDLQERWDKARALEAYQEAMAACQAEIPAILKEGENKNTHSKYVELSAIVRLIKPVYTKHGFALSFYEADTPKPNMIRCCCDVMHKSGHRETKWIELPADGTGAKGGSTAMNAVQGIGSTHSYAQRYLTCDIFFIQRADDLDGEVPSGPVTDEQWEILNSLLEETGLLNDQERMKRFKTWAKVDKLSDMSAAFFPQAITQLRRIKEGKK